MGTTNHEDDYGVVNTTINVASVAANISVEQTFTVTGLTTNMFVSVSKPAITAGLGISSARVSANDTLAITFINATAGALDPGSETYKVFWFLPEKAIRTTVVLS